MEKKLSKWIFFVILCAVNMSSLTPSKVKLVLLGDTAVGKTCIVQRYVNDDFTDDLNSTIGGAKAVV